MSCLDCENKAKTKNEKLDALRSGKYEETMAIVEINGELEIMPVMQAIGLPIKEVIMK